MNKINKNVKGAILTSVIILLWFQSVAQVKEQIWWPSKYGANDVIGAANLLSPQKLLEASSLIKKGEIYQLGRYYEREMPKGGRTYKLSVQGSPSDGPFGKNKTFGMSEMILGELAQVGTQFDGLGHFGANINGEDRFYNGFKRAEVVNQFGNKKLGVEHVGPIFTRGILLDIANYLQKKRLPAGYVITSEEIQGFLNKHNLRINQGDVVLIRTGHGQLWEKDNAAYMDGEPGIGIDAANWLAEQGVVLIGSDNYAIEVHPHESTDLFFPVHFQDLTKNGIYHIEHMDLEELSQDKVFEFAFVFIPVPFKGASGSPGNPIAIK